MAKDIKKKILSLRRNEKLVKVLEIMIGAGIVGTFVAFPILPFALKPLLSAKGIRFRRKEVERLLESMKDKGWISVENDGKIKITPKGDLYLKIWKLDEIEIQRKNWDGKWRLVMFDIPNSRKWARDYFRRFLKRAGFLMLQESVFIFPYPCEREVREVCEVLGIWECVNVLRVDRVDKEEMLLRKFELRK